MRLKITRIIAIYLSILTCQNITCQDEMKSWEVLQNQPFSVLFQSILDIRKSDRDLAAEISSKTLEKALLEGTESQKIYAYQMVAITSPPDERRMESVRKILALAELPQNNKNLAAAYFLRGKYKYDTKNFGDALEDFLVCDKLISEKDSFALKIKVSTTIAMMRSRIGQYDEALESYRKILFNQRKNNNLDKLGYTYHYIANTFLKLGSVDSAAIYIEKWHGLKPANKNVKTLTYINLLQSFIHLEKDDFEKAITLIESVRKELAKTNELSNLISCYYILGKANIGLGNNDIGLRQLAQFDSIFRISNRLIPEISDGWDPLIKHFSKLENREKQLYYMESIIRADSILSNDHKELYEKITSELDIKKIKEERDAIKQTSEQKMRIKQGTIWGMAVLLLLAIIFLVIVSLKNKKNRKNYQALLINRELNSKVKPEFIKVEVKTSASNLSDELILQLESGLLLFEKSLGYLEQGLTINNVAKTIGTNHKYLSKYINDCKGNSFPNYLNALRINYALNKLDNDKLFHKWTISAIAKDVGFSSSKYFTNAFKNITGIKPTYYIKEHFTEVNS